MRTFRSAFNLFIIIRALSPEVPRNAFFSSLEPALAVQQGEILFGRYPDDQTVGRHVVQSLAALGPGRHHEPDRQEEQGEKFHEVANGRLSEPHFAAVSGDDLQTQNALTDGGAPR